MGQVSTEQTVAIIDSVANALNTKAPVTKVIIETPDPNYWWLLSLGVIPVVLGWWLNKKRKK